MTTPGFREELETLINKHSMETGSDTPDFILAEFLEQSLAAFDLAVSRRTEFYNTAKTDRPPPDAVEPR